MGIDALTAGRTLDFVTSIPAYPATSGWTLKYRLNPHVSGTPIDITATSSGADFRVAVAAAATNAWLPGAYSWNCWVENVGGESHAIDGGETVIKPNPTSVSAYDARTTAQRALEDAEAALANFNATGGRVKRYAIAGREMEFDGASELVKLVNYWTNVVRLENAAKAVAAGQPDSRRIHVRMSNA
jgi:hypothetical protein